MRRPERLNDAQLLDAATSAFARATRLPIVFGGYHDGDAALVTSLSGNRTPSLNKLRVETGRGLGGAALLEARPRFTAHYEHSRTITHDYDLQIKREGIMSLIAVPVVIGLEVRAVLYGGAYEQTPLAPVMQRPVADVINEFARELRLRDEIRLRAAAIEEAEPAGLPTPLLEDLRESYAELRSVSTSIEDPALRARLEAIEAKLAHLGGVDAGAALTSRATNGPKLTPREIDVLSQVALGCTNAEVGRALGLTESTVKAYMKSAAAKLNASNRHAAVAAARREHIIP